MSSVLLAAFDATEADLEANRQGHLSDAQRRKLFLKRCSCDVTVLSGLLTVPLILPVAIIILLSGSENAACAGVVLVGVVAWFGWLALLFYQSRTDGKDGVVHTLHGRIKVGEGLAPTQGCMRVEGRRFLVPQKVTQALKKGATYTVYYAPHTGIALSVEEGPTRS